MLSRQMLKFPKSVPHKINQYCLAASGKLHQTLLLHRTKFDVHEHSYNKRHLNCLIFDTKRKTSTRLVRQLSSISALPKYRTMSTSAGSGGGGHSDNGVSTSANQERTRVLETDAVMMTEALEIFDCAVNSVLPHQMIGNRLEFDRDNSVLRIDGRVYRLHNNVHVVGFGKAVLGMARAVEDCIGQHIVQGLISIPVGAQEALLKEGKHDMVLQDGSKIQVIEGAENNMPDKAAHTAAMKISSIVREVGEGDVLIVLISGGGSALLPAPVSPVTLADMLTVTQLMSRAGANIMHLNTVRKHLEMLKGGGIAKLAWPAQVISLILSDVIGDPLDFIASGPTVPDHTTPQECLDLFDRLGIMQSIPQSVLSFLRKEAQQHSRNNLLDPNLSKHQTVNTENCATSSLEVFDSEENKIWSNVQNFLVGTNKIACDAACEKSAVYGYSPFILSTELDGEACEVGKMFGSLARYITLCSLSDYDREQEEDLRDIQKVLKMNCKMGSDKLKEIQEFVRSAKVSESKGFCIVAGGETTVTVRGSGRGGRNQEMAVAAALEFQKQFTASSSSLFSELRVVFLSAGTDGQDGPTPAAGGVISLDFGKQVEAAGMNALDSLQQNDTYSLLSQINGGSNLVMTGLTGTNVMDIHLLLVQATHQC